MTRGELGGGLRRPSKASPPEAVRAAGQPRAGPHASEVSNRKIAPAKPALEPRSWHLAPTGPLVLRAEIGLDDAGVLLDRLRRTLGDLLSEVQDGDDVGDL